jgi:hypothetical protein
MKGEKAPLSPVSEAQYEEDDDGGLVMYDVAEVGVPAVSFSQVYFLSLSLITFSSNYSDRFLMEATDGSLCLRPLCVI